MTTDAERLVESVRLLTALVREYGNPFHEEEHDQDIIAARAFLAALRRSTPQEGSDEQTINRGSGPATNATGSDIAGNVEAVNGAAESRYERLGGRSEGSSPSSPPTTPTPTDGETAAGGVRGFAVALRDGYFVGIYRTRETAELAARKGGTIVEMVAASPAPDSAGLVSVPRDNAGSGWITVLTTDGQSIRGAYRTGHGNESWSSWPVKDRVTHWVFIR